MFSPFSLRVALAAVPALAIVTPAYANPASAAADPAEVRSQAVSFHDLDLSTPRGRAMLHRRLRFAAQDVCDYNGGPRPLSEQAAAQECYDRAMRNADAALARLTTDHQMAVK